MPLDRRQCVQLGLLLLLGLGAWWFGRDPLPNDGPALSDNRVFTAVYNPSNITLTVIRETFNLHLPLISR